MKKIQIIIFLIIVLSSCGENNTTTNKISKENNSGNTITNIDSGSIYINNQVNNLTNETKSNDTKEVQKKALEKLLKPNNKIETNLNKTNSGNIVSEISSGSNELSDEEIELAKDTNDEEIDKLIDILFENN